MIKPQQVKVQVFSEGGVMAIDGTRPERVWCTGTEHCTIVVAYPSHRAVNVVDQKGAGEDEIAYDPQCSQCREEAGEEP
jgi:hypothetical protein